MCLVVFVIVVVVVVVVVDVVLFFLHTLQVVYREQGRAPHLIFLQPFAMKKIASGTFSRISIHSNRHNYCISSIGRCPTSRHLPRLVASRNPSFNFLNAALSNSRRNSKWSPMAMSSYSPHACSAWSVDRVKLHSDKKEVV